MLSVMSELKATHLSGDQVARQTPSRNRTFWLPDVVLDRLDDLVQVMEDEGFTARRADLVAALICQATDQADTLQRMVQAYRQARVREVSLREPDESNAVEIRPARPGPRRRQR